MIPLIVIIAYLCCLLGLGLISARRLQNTSGDFFLASRSIGPFLLLMSLFGTTMTAFALVGSTGKAYNQGIGVYGMMASWSGLIHSAIFFLVGAKLWRLGKLHGYTTQVQFFKDRFQSRALGTMLFPILVALVVPYLLIGLLGAGLTVRGVTRGVPELFSGEGVPVWLTSAVICVVVYTYVFFGGLRAAAWANAFQTIVFLVVGIIAFITIANALGGLDAAIEQTRQVKPDRLVRGDAISQRHFLSYVFVPLSVAMFPHLFQHWLTARNAKAFRLPVVLHPILIMIVWVPCILIGVWAAGQLSLPPQKAKLVLGVMVKKFTDPWMAGLVTAGILAAIMSSLDSQFLCLGTMFTHDVALQKNKNKTLTEAQKIKTARIFVGLVVAGTFVLSLFTTKDIFDLGVWCFSGFAGLAPLVIAALYWRRTTAAGAMASVVATAVTWIALFLQSMSHDATQGEFLIAGLMPVTFIVLASTVSLVVVSLCTRPLNPQHLDRFFTKAHPPSQSN